MCELMGMCFAKPISAGFSIHEFALRGEENADGWGLAWYPDKSLALIKEPLKWRTSPHTGFLETYQHLLSQIYLAHVRHKTTGGEPSHADTHPFSRELDGREYCFAHNGTILGPFWELPLGRFRPIGKTDSEHLFCHLLGELAGGADTLAAEADWRWLHGRLIALNRQGRINCLLSDGRRLFCYHDANGWKGLALSKVYIRDHKSRRFEDATMTINLEGELADHSVNQGFVVATRPLSDKGWTLFEKGELIVMEDGMARFSTHRSC